MHILPTRSTALLAVLIVYLWYRAKGRFMPVMMFLSIFQAASLVNIGLGGQEIGFAPSYVVLLFVLFRNSGRRRQEKVGAPNPRATTLLVFFVAYSALSAILFPLIFGGVTVTSPRAGADVPLEWGTNNLTQLIYLMMSFAFYLVAAYRTSPAELTKSLDWYVGGAFLAALVAMYQFLSMKTGVPFPKEFLYTNPTYVIYDAYEINGFPRMNSTFTEASAAAFSFTTALALVLWQLLSGKASVRNIAVSLVIGIGLVLTLSTTGYVCLAYLLLGTSGLYFFHSRGSSSFRITKIVLAVPALGLALAFVAAPGLRESLLKLVNTVVIDKSESRSYQDRNHLNESALATASETHWLGAGWGSCRASSFIATTLGNVGVPGLLLFCSFCWVSLIPLVRRRSHSGSPPIRGAIAFSAGAVLLALVVATPEPVHPIIWLLFAVSAKLAVSNRRKLFRPSLSHYPGKQPVLENVTECLD